MSRVLTFLVVFGMAGFLFGSELLSVSKTAGLIPKPQAVKIEIPVNLTVLNPAEPLSQQIDTLKNDDGTPRYYWMPPTAIFAARLTPIAPCTLQYLLFCKYRKGDTLDPTVCGCSLFVWKDTIIGGQHYPGRTLLRGYARESLPSSPYNAYWIAYNLTSANFRLGADHFWAGYRFVPETGGGADPTDTLWPLGDNGSLEPDRNAAAEVSSGPWELLGTASDLMIRAIVKREPTDVHDIEVLSVNNSQGYFMPNPGNAELSGEIKNSGTVSENNFPVVCTVYTEAGSPVYNSTFTVTTPLAPGATTPINFTPNWTPNTDGVYYIVVRSLLPEDMRPNNDRKMREGQVCSSPAELRYDDGQRDNAWAFYRKGNGWANKFVPPYYPAKLTAVKYCAWSDSWPSPGGTRIVARVLDDDGEGGLPGTVLWEDTVDVVRGTFTEFDVDPDIQINSGAFYVAWIQADTWIHSPGLSVDEDLPLAMETYTFLQDTWSYEAGYGDWMIRAKIERPGPPPQPGWARKADVSGQPSGKAVKGGGGITARGDTTVYLILGNNTLDFLKYSVSTNSWTAITPGVPVGPKNKKVKKGAYIVDSDREDKGIEGEVYILKGGGTNEFYKYDPMTKGWDSLPEPGFTKGVKGGFAAFVELGKDADYIYAGSGSNNNEWKRYNISTRTWEAMTPGLPVEKAKVGSGFAYDGAGKLYFLHGGGKTNDFWVIDLTSPAPTWTAKRELPMAIPGSTKKKKVKEGGSIEFFDGKVYAVKGGNTKQFWYYEPAGDSWHYVGEVGDGLPAKGIKCGRSLTSTSTGIYCIIGNNTNEFWFYGGAKSFANTLRPAISGKTVLTQGFTFDVRPNPTNGLTHIYYTLPTKEIATLRIYNPLGELVYSAKTDKGFFAIKKLPAGIYILRFATKGYNAEKKLVVTQ